MLQKFPDPTGQQHPHVQMEFDLAERNGTGNVLRVGTEFFHVTIAAAAP